MAKVQKDRSQAKPSKAKSKKDVAHNPHDLDENQTLSLVQKLVLIHIEDELDTLLDFALTTHSLEHFIKYLPNDNETQHKTDNNQL